MKSAYTGIDVLNCVQGNTVRIANAADFYNESCVVYDFNREAFSRRAASESVSERKVSRRPVSMSEQNRRRRIKNRRKQAAKARARRALALRMAVLAAFLIMVFGIGGIASRAQSRKAPDAYKYYDTITVAYQENLLDIVQRYDDRDYYETQLDYVEELCRINNLTYDGTAYPDIAPGTHLVVPYYSTELK